MKKLCLALAFIAILAVTACGDNEPVPSETPPAAPGTPPGDEAPGAERNVPPPVMHTPSPLDLPEDLAVPVAQALEEIGELTYNQAYQFVLSANRYVMLTGFRPLMSVEEVQQYYPGLNLPEQMGDFTFRYFISWGQWTDGPMVGETPFQQGRGDQPPDEFEILSLQEVFTRDVFLPAFSALYQDSRGQVARLTVSFDVHTAWCGVLSSCAIHDDLHFTGFAEGSYRQVIYLSETRSMMATLDVIDQDLHRSTAGSRFDYPVLQMDLDELAAIAELFGLSGIIDRHGWQIIPWDDPANVFWVSPPCAGWT